MMRVKKSNPTSLSMMGAIYKGVGASHLVVIPDVHYEKPGKPLPWVTPADRRNPTSDATNYLEFAA